MAAVACLTAQHQAPLFPYSVRWFRRQIKRDISTAATDRWQKPCCRLLGLPFTIALSDRAELRKKRLFSKLIYGRRFCLLPIAFAELMCNGRSPSLSRAHPPRRRQMETNAVSECMFVPFFAVHFDFPLNFGARKLKNIYILLEIVSFRFSKSIRRRII